MSECFETMLMSVKQELVSCGRKESCNDSFHYFPDDGKSQ